MQNVVLSLLLVAFGLSTYAQLPELQAAELESLREIREVEKAIDKAGTGAEPGFLLSLARNYYLLDNYAKAEVYYLKIINHQICGNLDYKALSLTLLHNEKYALSREFAKFYEDGSGDTEFLNKLNSIIDQKEDNNFIHNRELSATEFAYGHKINGELLLSNGTSTFIGEQSGNQIVKTSEIPLPKPSSQVLGSFTYGPLPNSIIYSAMDENGLFKLYFTTEKNEKYKKAKRIELGMTGANVIHPYYKNGTLYFASDASMGAGGYDLYKALYTQGEWSEPESLGSNINSEKNEILPSLFLGQLCFSSNGHAGFGGYDLYEVEGSKINNLGKSVNSLFNEFVLIGKNATESSVLTEKEKQFHVTRTLTVPNLLVTRSIEISDKQGQPIQNAYVLVQDADKNGGIFSRTNEQGVAQFSLNKNVLKWSIHVMAEGYDMNTFDFWSKDFRDQGLKVQMEKTTVPIDPVYVVNSASESIPVVEPETSEYPIAETYPLESDDAQTTSDVFDEFAQSSGSYFIIIGSARSYPSAYNFLNQWKSKFPEAQILENKEEGIYRVGIDAGNTETEAMAVYRRSRKIKESVWLLRPKDTSY